MLGLVTHENTDISCAAVELLSEMTDPSGIHTFRVFRKLHLYDMTACPMSEIWIL